MASNAILIQGLIELHLKGEGGDKAVASMTKIIAQAKEVEKATGGLGTGATHAADGVGKLEASFISLGKTVATYFAAGVVANFLRDSLLGFARTERQALALEQQLKNLGDQAGAASFRGFISQTSQAYGILDDDLVPALQRALLGFKNLATAEEVVTLASKFAANGIGDVGTNVERLTRFFQTGSARSLVDFGINVKGGEEATLDLNEGIKLLIETASGMPATFDDAQKSLNQWRNDLDAAKDAIGKLEAGIIRAVQAAGTFVGENLPTFFSPENIVKEAEGQKLLDDLAVEGEKKKVSKLSALAAQAAEEQKRRDKKANDEKTKESIKSEHDRLEKVLSMNEETQKDLIKEVIDVYQVGTVDRLNLEIALNDKIRAEAIKNAKAIGADTAAINALFDEKSKAKEREFINATGPEPGSGGPDPRVEAERKANEEIERLAREHEDAMFELETAGAELRNQINADSLRWAEESEKQKTQSALNSAAQIAGVLSSTFAKHKAFAIAMAIANTALAITAAWKDESLPGYWAKIAAIVTIAASGAAQIAAIRGASLSGGGGAPSIASAPTSPATGTGGGSVSIAPQSQSQLASLSGRPQSASTSGIVINIEHAFGDQQSMTKLAREINRINANNRGNLR